MNSHHHHHHDQDYHVSPGIVTIGTKKEELNTFDDLPALKKHPAPYRIHRIKVQFNKELILGLCFSYMASDDQNIDGHDNTKFKPLGQLFGHVHEEIFEINQEDELLEISGRAGDRINEIGFKTYRGQSKTFGNPHGKVFSFQFPGATFGAVSGGYGELIDYIEVRVQSLPPERVTSMTSK